MYKKPWLAALLNLTLTGVGYLYLGKRKLFGWLLISLGISYSLWYFANYETYKSILDHWIYYAVSFLITVPFAVDAYRLAKKMNGKAKHLKSARDSKAFRYTFISFFMLFVILDILLGAMVIQHTMGWIKYTSVEGESVIRNNDAYTLSNNVALFAVGLSILFIPLLAWVFKNKKIHIAIPLTAFGLLFAGLIGLSSIDDSYKNAVKQAKNGVPITTAGDTFSEKELFDAINKERKANKVPVLKHDKSTCAIAKLRVEEVAEKGTAIYSSSAAFQRAIDRAFENDKSIDREVAPDWYGDYLTYEETPEGAIEIWKSGETKDLFNKAEFTYGCVAVKSGYAIVVIGYYDPESETSTQEEKHELQQLMESQGSATLL